MNDNDPDDETPTSIATALAIVSMLALTGYGLKLANDRCVIQVPTLPQFGGVSGSPTLLPVEEVSE